MVFDIKKFYRDIRQKLDKYMDRRPHRSFQVSRRRDYKRRFDLSGYISFTNNCLQVLYKNKKLFGLVVATYLLSTILLIGMASQDNYSSLVDTLTDTSGDVLDDFWGRVGGASLLFVASISGGFLQTLSEAQQIYVTIITVITGLVVVWLLRNILAGKKAKLRDGLYNAGTPIVPVVLIMTLILVQLLPLGLVFIGYNAALNTGLLDGGVEAMLFWIVATLLTSLSLYWVLGSIFAMIIVTLPGMYPYTAIKMAGDMVTGRRLKITLRLIWMVIFASIIWCLVMIPAILIDMWLKNLIPSIEWLPIIPVLLIVMTGATVVWIVTYVYMLYRKLVDNETVAS